MCFVADRRGPCVRGREPTIGMPGILFGALGWTLTHRVADSGVAPLVVVFFFFVTIIFNTIAFGGASLSWDLTPCRKKNVISPHNAYTAHVPLVVMWPHRRVLDQIRSENRQCQWFYLSKMQIIQVAGVTGFWIPSNKLYCGNIIFPSLTTRYSNALYNVQ